MSMLHLQIFIPDEFKGKATLPSKAHPSDACWDLFALEDTVIKPLETKMVNTGLIMNIPFNHRVAIYSRSGLASKGIQVANCPGIIDEHYRGLIQVLLYNSTSKEVTIPKEKAIAQFALEELLCYNIVEVSEINLDTDRGSNGFGSSDKKKN